MDSRKTIAAGEVSHSIAHHLTAIHELRARRGYARVSDVARELQLTKGSVSLQMKHLKERGLVEEDENRFLLLTPAGEAIAHEVIRSRQVLIEFMTGVLGITEEQARIDACKMEHLLSKETSHQLLAMVHLLQSDDAAARDFRDRFRDYTLRCAGGKSCPICSIQETPAERDAPSSR